MNRNLLLFLALTALSAPTWAQSQFDQGNANITYSGPPGSPGYVSAVQGALPNAQVSPASAAPPRSAAESALIGRAPMIPVGPPSTDNPPLVTPQDEVESSPVFPESPGEIAERAAAVWEAGSADQDIRQKGITIGQGDRFVWSIAASKLSQDQVALSRWKAWLPQFGVDPAKIEDESRRLDRKTFDTWASRFVWFSCSSHASASRPLGCASLVTSAP